MFHNKLLYLITLLFLSIFVSANVQAASTQSDGGISGSGNVIFETVQFVWGSENFNYHFEAGPPGIIITLTDFADQLDSLSISPFETLELFVTTATTVLGELSEPGVLTINLEETDNIFLSVKATVLSGVGDGLFGIEVVPVPIPAGFIFLLTGLLGLLPFKKLVE